MKCYQSNKFEKWQNAIDAYGSYQLLLQSKEDQEPICLRESDENLEDLIQEGSYLILQKKKRNSKNSQEEKKIEIVKSEEQSQNQTDYRQSLKRKAAQNSKALTSLMVDPNFYERQDYLGYGAKLSSSGSEESRNNPEENKNCWNKKTIILARDADKHNIESKRKQQAGNIVKSENFKRDEDIEIVSQYKTHTFKNIKDVENVLLAKLNANHDQEVFSVHFTDSYLTLKCNVCKNF